MEGEDYMEVMGGVEWVKFENFNLFVMVGEKEGSREMI